MARFVSTKTGAEVWQLECDEWYCNPYFSPDGKTLALGSGNRASGVYLYDFATRKEMQWPGAKGEDALDAFEGSEACAANFEMC